MFKKFMLFLMTFAMIFGMGMTAFAAETLNSNNTGYHQEYVQLVNDGILGEDVTFEYWQEVKERSARLEAELENSTEFTKVYDSITLKSSYSMQPGDVFVTNGTDSKGLTGHAGIAISSTKILHIAGPGEYPSTITLANWNKNYTKKGWTKVYRHKDEDVASDAAEWAKDTYEGSDAEYKIDMRLDTTHETYCSKIVWQAYYYGPDKHNANGPTIGIRAPYDLPKTVHHLSLVETFENE